MIPSGKHYDLGGPFGCPDFFLLRRETRGVGITVSSVNLYSHSVEVDITPSTVFRTYNPLYEPFPPPPLPKGENIS